MKLAVDLSLLSRRPSGPSYDSAAAALFARFTSQPNTIRKGQINALIVALKAAGVWSKLDALYIHAAHDAQAARRNWVADAYNESPANSPTFTTDRGYTGDGASSYLSTGFSPNTSPSPKYTQINCHMGVWIGTNVPVTTQWDCGHSRALLVGLASTSAAAIRSNQTSGVSFPLPANTSVGWLCQSRNNPTNFNAKKDSATPTTLAQNASGLAIGGDFFCLAIANISNLPSNWSTRRVQAFHFGAYLTDAEMAAFYAALNTYMTAIGAV